MRKVDNEDNEIENSIKDGDKEINRKERKKVDKMMEEILNREEKNFIVRDFIWRILLSKD